MSDFLFHKVSEKEKEDIRKEAKEIMDNFSVKLGKIQKSVKEPFIEREDFEREENLILSSKSEDFRKRMFENAPEKNQDFIIAEKKSWK